MPSTFTHRSLYQKYYLGVPLHIRLLVLFVAVVAPLNAFGDMDKLRGKTAFQQEFIITGYYSPLPGQCCYATGGLHAEKRMNGQGIAGADGTPVFPGMIAAPKSYPFGTVVTLPGIGTFRVHDRGGAIVEKADGTIRLDIWTGYGEEGLARAVGIGWQRMTGMVYPVNARQPTVDIDLASLPSSFAELERYIVHDNYLLAMTPAHGEWGKSVQVMQQAMKDAGYFPGKISGQFDDNTHTWLRRFIRDYQIGESPDRLSEKTAAFLLAAARRGTSVTPLGGYINDDASAGHIGEAQRLLRFLGFYTGRTNGLYDELTKNSILLFQQVNGLALNWESPGAGQIGPITLERLRGEWNRILVTRLARKWLDYHLVLKHLYDNGDLVDEFLEEGEGGAQVRILQTMLANTGHFDREEINGHFGPATKSAVSAYQLEHGLISSLSEEGAGRVGPQTLKYLRNQVHRMGYRLVRERGWRAL